MSFRENSEWNELNELRSLVIFKKLASVASMQCNEIEGTLLNLDSALLHQGYATEGWDQIVIKENPDSSGASIQGPTHQSIGSARKAAQTGEFKR